ncbi:hypothetical protein VNO77_18778 [Canavalia gladiata]|uniref:Uncharacterized protein n=1 Tax=Canavalia gladiata TaxID=3824 RepID=A0AAN9LLJ6_CANGL
MEDPIDRMQLKVGGMMSAEGIGYGGDILRSVIRASKPKTKNKEDIALVAMKRKPHVGVKTSLATAADAKKIDRISNPTKRLGLVGGTLLRPLGAKFESQNTHFDNLIYTPYSS